MKNELKQYIEDNASLPPEVVLGHIVWFEVTEGPYAPAALAESFARHHLNTSFLPGPINPADAFEKAAKEVEGLKYPIVHNGHSSRAEILVREHQRNDSAIVRHLIREIRDEKVKDLRFTKVGEFAFYRPTTGVDGKIDHSTCRVRSNVGDPLAPFGLDPKERELIVALVADFDARYDRHKRNHDGQKMRALLRGYLLHLNGVLMKSGVYFVHQNRAAELQALKAFTEEFPGLKLTLWQIPNLEVHREEVVEAFQKEAEDALAGVVAEIAKVRESRKGGTVSPAQYQRIKAMYDKVQAQSGEHQRTLKITHDRTSAASELALQALTSLQLEIFAPKPQAQAS